MGDQEYYILDEHLDETWQDLDHDELNDWSDEELDWGDRTEGEGPPVLTPDELERTEMASRKTEIERLLKMKVLEEVPELPPGAKMLQTRRVMDWRFREGRWIRRARLVCKELRIWDPNRQGVYAPSTNPSISKLLPAIVASCADWQLMAFDVKDAFLTVPQRDELYVNLDGLAYRVRRCLPGQQMASAMWGEQLAEDLKSTGLVADAACPAAFGCPGMGATVHVDDGLVGGTTEGLDAVKHVLQQKYKLEVSNYMGNVGDSVKFLKNQLLMVEEGTQLKLNPRYLAKICESLRLSKTRPRKTPCAEISQPDETEPLDEVAASRYRAAIGSFLYLSPDRPDCQWTIGHLARSMSKPTKKMYKHACHLAEYLQCTKDVNLTMKWSYPGRSALGERKLMRDEAQALQLEKAGEPDLLEFNGNVTFCFVRKQGCVSLSSCEAELVACCSAAAEALYVQRAVETLTSHSCRITCRLDSSSARSLLLQKGVSKVRHLDTKLLWLQRAHSQGQLELSAVGTHLNTSDIGTKQLTSERYRFLLGRMGYSTDIMPGFHNVTQIQKVEAEVVKYLMVLEALRSLPPASAQSVSHDEPNVEMTNLEIVFQSSNALSIKGADLIGGFFVHTHGGGQEYGVDENITNQEIHIEDLVAQEIYIKNIAAQKIYIKNIAMQKIYIKNIAVQKIYMKNIAVQKIYIKNIAMQKIYMKNIAVQKIYIKNIAVQKIYIKDVVVLKNYIFVLIRRKMYSKILKVNIIANLAMHQATCSLLSVIPDQEPESDNQQFQMHAAHQYQMKW